MGKESEQTLRLASDRILIPGTLVRTNRPKVLVLQGLAAAVPAMEEFWHTWICGHLSPVVGNNRAENSASAGNSIRPVFSEMSCSKNAHTITIRVETEIHLRLCWENVDVHH